MKILRTALTVAAIPSLIQLVHEDQKERKEYQDFVAREAGGDWEKGAQLYARHKKRSPDDLFGERERLERFMRMSLDFQKFEEQDWENYWLLAQHCDFDRKFQQKALKIIHDHEGESERFKYLSDRISCGKNGSQRYHTQDVCERDQ